MQGGNYGIVVQLLKDSLQGMSKYSEALYNA